MDYAGIVIGLAGLAAAWLAIRHVRRLETQLDALYDRYFVLSNRVSEMEEMQARLAERRADMRRPAGNPSRLPQFQPDPDLPIIT